MLHAEAETEAYHRSQASSSSFDGFRLLVWLAAAILPWAVIYALGHKLFGI